VHIESGVVRLSQPGSFWNWTATAERKEVRMKRDGWLLILLLAAFETVNATVISWAIGGPWGSVVGLFFALIGLVGTFIPPSAPRWCNPLWSVLALPVNAAVIGGAAFKVAAILFWEPIVPWMIVMLAFVGLHALFVYWARREFLANIGWT